MINLDWDLIKTHGLTDIFIHVSQLPPFLFLLCISALNRGEEYQMHYMQPSFLKFCLLNIRSLCTGFDILSDSIIENCYDIVGLSETWLRPDIDDHGVGIDEFNIVRKDRDGRGLGVAFYIKNHLKFTVLAVHQNSPLEQLWISLKCRGKKMCLGTLYRPPSAPLAQCIDALEDTLVALIPEYECIAFGGDFNVDFAQLNSPNCQSFQLLLDRYGLTQCITSPTRVNQRSGTLLDLLICSDQSMIVSPDTVDMSEISDHKLVTFDIKVVRSKPVPIFKTYRDFKHFNHTDFVQDLFQIDWDTIYSYSDIDEMIDFFSTNLKLLFDKHAPSKTAKITKCPAPWLTDTLKFMMKLRDKALSRYKKNRTGRNRAEYTALRNQVNIAVRAEKKALLQFTFRRDPRNFWRTIKYLNLTSHSKSSSQLDVSPDEFNDFFVTSLPPILSGNSSC